MAVSNFLGRQHELCNNYDGTQTLIYALISMRQISACHHCSLFQTALLLIVTWVRPAAGSYFSIDFFHASHQVAPITHSQTRHYSTKQPFLSSHMHTIKNKQQPRVLHRSAKDHNILTLPMVAPAHQNLWDTVLSMTHLFQTLSVARHNGFNVHTRDIISLHATHVTNRIATMEHILTCAILLVPADWLHTTRYIPCHPRRKSTRFEIISGWYSHTVSSSCRLHRYSRSHTLVL